MNSKEPTKSILARKKNGGGWEIGVRIEVEDTGPGLSQEIMKHLFEPYVRGANAEVPGLGLGLATVQRLVQAHGGAVGVQSMPGQGSLFWFELPLAGRTA